MPTENQPESGFASARPYLQLRPMRGSVFPDAGQRELLGWLACLRVLVKAAEHAVTRRDDEAGANAASELVWFLVATPASAHDLHRIANDLIVALDAGDAGVVARLRATVAVAEAELNSSLAAEGEE